MKKFLYILFILLCFILLVSCGKVESDNKTYSIIKGMDCIVDLGVREYNGLSNFQVVKEKDVLLVLKKEVSLDFYDIVIYIDDNYIVLIRLISKYKKEE